MRQIDLIKRKHSRDNNSTIIPSQNYKTRLIINMDKSLKNDDMSNRLKKAVIQLIKLNGGKVSNYTIACFTKLIMYSKFLVSLTITS